MEHENQIKEKKVRNFSPKPIKNGQKPHYRYKNPQNKCPKHFFSYFKQ